MITQIRSDFLTKIVKAGRFNELEANVIFHYRERAGDTLLGLFIQDKRDPDLILVYVAERGRIVNGASGNYLVLENGSVQRETPRNRDASIVAFQRYALDLTQLVPGNGEITFSPHERLTDDLLQAYFSGRETSVDLVRIEAELADRFATPFYAFPFACLALGFLGRPRSTRAHRMNAVLYTIAGAAIIRVAGFVFIVNGKALPFYLFGSIAFPLVCAVNILVFDALFGHRLTARSGFNLIRQNATPSPSGHAS
jgi:lipopolysaccharide export system permease protein